MNTAEKYPRITAEEYYKMTESDEVRTELLDGEIVALARPNLRHQRISYRMFHSIDGFIRSHNGDCEVHGEIDVQLFEDTVVVPDLSVICDPSKLDENRCNGAPDWVVEITSTNRENDFDRKFYLYQSTGVREYWIVDTLRQKVFVYDFEQHPSVVSFYDWTDEVPVHIYQGRLKIRISDLI